MKAYQKMKKQVTGNEKASDRKEADEMLAITGLTEAQKTAHNEGYKKGYKDGWADGYHDGKNESQKGIKALKIGYVDQNPEAGKRIPGG